MSYSETLTITLPATLADIAASIARSLDPDVGGEYSFKPDVIGYTEGDKPEPIYGKTISCTTPCEPHFLAQAEYMMLHPEALHAAVSADYATRWPDLPCPTLADCQAFCAAIVYEQAPPD